MEYERKYFIEQDRDKATFIQWLTSKGTNYTCYQKYMESLNDEAKLNNIISVVRTILYSLNKPIDFIFFYWTILVFMLHKFNFKKPVMKIILIHYVLRATGNTLDKFGSIFKYYVNDPIYDPLDSNHVIGYQCKNSGNMHPFRWFLTRQIGTICWYVGEIVGDWYLLLRTRAIVKNKSIRYVYATCAFFNISKIALIVLHLCLNPAKIYKSDGTYDLYKMDMFYFNYWFIQLIIIYASMIYDISVYIVLKNNIFILKETESGFLKKFKILSEYRILVSTIFCGVFLPLCSFTIFLKFYYYYKYGYHKLNFSFDDIRQSIASVQYYMIFIDQILLIHSKKVSYNNSDSNKIKYIDTFKYKNCTSSKYKYSKIGNYDSNSFVNKYQKNVNNFSNYLSNDIYDRNPNNNIDQYCNNLDSSKKYYTINNKSNDNYFYNNDSNINYSNNYNINSSNKVSQINNTLKYYYN